MFRAGAFWKQRRLLEGRYWAAVPIVALIVIAGVGVRLSLEDPQPPAKQEAKAETQPIKCEERGFWGRTVCDPIAGFTGVLALFSGLLTLVSFIQIRYLILADETARISADAAKNAAKAAVTQATEAAKTAGFMAQQSEIFAMQKEIARLQLITNNRPFFRVRNVLLNEDGGGWNYCSGNVAGECYVENLGAMHAVIVESHLEVFAAQMGLPAKSPYEGKAANNVFGSELEIGKPRLVTFGQASPFATRQEAERAWQGGFPTYVIGWIHYQADTKDTVISNPMYRLTFARKWNAVTRRFEAIQDHDYEHLG